MTENLPPTEPCTDPRHTGRIREQLGCTGPDPAEAQRPCEQHPTAPRIGGVCGGCTQYPADMAAALAEPTHMGPDPSHGGLTTHRGHRADCTGPDCGPDDNEPAADRRYWIAVNVPAAEVDNDLPDALSYAADRAEAVLQDERGYDATAWHAADDHPADAEQPRPHAPLTDTERTMLRYALDQAQERIWSEDGFTDEDQAAVTSLRRLTEQRPAPRILTDDEDEAAYNAARGILPPSAGSVAIEDALTAAFAAVGILTQPPAPDPDTCPAQFADREGYWHQCGEDPDHDPADGHSDGEWSWPHGDTYARPEPDEEQQRAAVPDPLDDEQQEPRPLSEAMRAVGCMAAEGFARGIAQAEARAAERQAAAEAQQSCTGGAAIDHDETGICNHAEPRQ